MTPREWIDAAAAVVVDGGDVVVVSVNHLHLE